MMPDQTTEQPATANNAEQIVRRLELRIHNLEVAMMAFFATLETGLPPQNASDATLVMKDLFEHSQKLGGFTTPHMTSEVRDD